MRKGRGKEPHRHRIRAGWVLGNQRGLPLCPVSSLHSRDLLLRGHRLQRGWRLQHGWEQRLQQRPLLWWQQRWWRLQFHQRPQHGRQQFQHAYHLQDVVHQEELQELKAPLTSAACPRKPPNPCPKACRFADTPCTESILAAGGTGSRQVAWEF